MQEKSKKYFKFATMSNQYTPKQLAEIASELPEVYQEVDGKKVLVNHFEKMDMYNDIKGKKLVKEYVEKIKAESIEKSK